MAAAISTPLADSMNRKLDVEAARRLLHFVELRDCCDVGIG
jgi:hypothetical protein